MKKMTALLLSLTLCTSLLTGCGKQADNSPSGETVAEETATVAEEGTVVEETTTTEESTIVEETTTTEEATTAEETAASADVRVTALKGPTAMGMVKLMEDAEQSALGDADNNNYEFTIAASVDEVVPKLVQGETDIAAVPANLASVLYNNTKGQVQVLAINTLGVLYIVDTGDAVHSVSDLKGRTIYASGKGATPEYALNYILSENGINPETDVTIEWKTEHSECVAALAASTNESEIALLPQPFVTTAQAKNEKIKIALDLTEEWNKLQENAETPSALLTGVIVARKEFVENNPEALNAFMDSYKASVEYVNGNGAEAAKLIEKYGIVPAAVAEKALPYCNIAFIEGSDMKEKLSGYLNVLKEQNPKAVGGEVPADDFYYSR